MRQISYRSYEKLIMNSTDPIKGWKIAMLLRDCHVSKIELIRALEDMEGLRLFIVYRKSESGNGVIELYDFDEFAKAQSFAAYHSWPFVRFRDIGLMINMGHADLNVLVDYEPNKVKLAAFLKQFPIEKDHLKDYTGIAIEEVIA